MTWRRSQMACRLCHVDDLKWHVDDLKWHVDYAM